MKALIPVYEKMKEVVKFFYKQLKLDKQEKHKGRKLAISIIDSISLALFKQKNNIATKKSIFNIFKPKCSYKTLVVNLNRFAHLALLILVSILKFNQRNSHLGIFVAEAAYVSKKLEKDFNIEGERILFAKPRKSMKRLMTEFQFFLSKTKMLIELNFRNLKMFYGLVTSLPRSVKGYLANYIYSLLAYQIA